MSNVNKLQKVQNFAARIVSNTRKYDHITPIPKKLKWLSVKNYLYYRDATLAFKCMTGLAPNYLRNKFICRGDVSKRNTRNSQLLNIPLFKLRPLQDKDHSHIVLLIYGTICLLI